MQPLFFNTTSKPNIHFFVFSYGPKITQGDNAKHPHVNLCFIMLCFLSSEIKLATHLIQFSLNLIFYPKGALLLSNADIAATPISTNLQLHLSVSRLTLILTTIFPDNSFHYI